MPVGSPSPVPIEPTDPSNVPHMHNVSVQAGRAYRVRAWPDTGANMLGMILTVHDPSGRLIKRQITQSGLYLVDKQLNQTNFRRFTDADSYDTTPRDVADAGCDGDTHGEFAFRATISGTYTLGLGHLVDSIKPRANFSSTLAFLMQTRAKLSFAMALEGRSDGLLMDVGWLGSQGALGSPGRGTFTLRVDEVTLPALPATELQAMLDIKSADRGANVPNSIWDPNEHPCLWSPRVPSMAPTCCFRNDLNGQLVSTVRDLLLLMCEPYVRGNAALCCCCYCCCGFPTGSVHACACRTLPG